MTTIKITTKIKQFLLLVGFLSFSSLTQAQPIDDGSGLLKRLTHEAIEKKVQDTLIRKITITNRISNKQAYKVTVSPGRAGGFSQSGRRYAAAPRRMARRAPARRSVQRYVARGASSTNVREQGVDEADLVKTDGRYLYAIDKSQGAGLRIYDTQYQGRKLKQLASMGFNKRLYLKGLYLLASQQKLVLFGDSYQNLVNRKRPGSTTILIYIDIRNKAQPRIIRQVYLEGSSRNSRRIGNKLYLVMNSYTFQLPPTNKYIETNKPLTQHQYELEKQRLINTIKKWRINKQLPHYVERGKPGSRSLVNSGNFYLNMDEIRSYSVTTIVTVDLSANHFKYEGIAYFGSPDSIYASQKALYLTSSFYNGNYGGKPKYKVDLNRYPQQSQKTLIHKFAYKNNSFDYRGSGIILGNLSWNRTSTFQLDEDKRGNLRVVSYNWRSGAKNNKSNDPATRSPVILTALAEQPGKKQLVTLSRLPNRYYPQALGKKNERLYGARLFDDYAYFVTFRQTDPMYVIDMRNPRSMKVAGKLFIPGFSDYLHPIENGLLLGIGKDADKRGRVKGVKLSLFDIRNPSRPREVSKLVVGDNTSHTPIGDDYHALTTLHVGKTSITRVVLPISGIEGLDSKKRYTYESALQRFEVDSKARKIKHLGPVKTFNGKGWYWNYEDRSIIIGDRVFHYHNGKFQEAPWFNK